MVRRMIDRTEETRGHREIKDKLVEITQEIMGDSFSVDTLGYTGIFVRSDVSNKLKLNLSDGVLGIDLRFYDPNYFEVAWDLARAYETVLGKGITLVKDFDKYFQSHNQRN